MSQPEAASRVDAVHAHEPSAFGAVVVVSVLAELIA